MGPTGKLGGIRKWWRTQPSPQSSLQILQPGCDQGSRDTAWLESPAQSSRASLVSKTSSFNNILSGRKDINAKKKKKDKKGFHPTLLQTAPESWVSFSSSFSSGPATIFPLPFKLRPRCSSLPGKHLHTAACGGNQPSSSLHPAVPVGATRCPQAAPGLGKMSLASTRATQLVFEVPMPSSPSPRLLFIM